MASRPHKPLRIAMLSIHSSPLGPLGTQDTGGMSVYVKELAKGLGRLGHQVDIFTYVQSPWSNRELYPNVRLIELNQDQSMVLDKALLPDHTETIFSSLEQYRLRHSQTYDLIHSHYWISAVVGAMAQKRWHCPHLTTFHTLGAAKNHTAEEKEPIRRIAHERWLAKVADGIVVPSPSERQNLLCHYHPRPEQIHTIPCGVNLDLFKPMDPLTARKQIGIGAETKMVLYVGRFAPVKGIDRLLGTLAQLKHLESSLQLVIVGGDDPSAKTTQTLKRQVRQLHIDKQVTFAGRIDQKDLPSYYCAADLLALPSHYESFGLVVLEALACGTPVVATPVGAAGTIIKEGVNGIIIDSPDQAGVVRAIHRMFKMPPAHGSQAIIRATVADFGWESIAASVVSAYTLLLDRQDPGRTPSLAADRLTHS